MGRFVAGVVTGAALTTAWFAAGQRILESSWKRGGTPPLQDFWDMEDW